MATEDATFAKPFDYPCLTENIDLQHFRRYHPELQKCLFITQNYKREATLKLTSCL